MGLSVLHADPCGRLKHNETFMTFAAVDEQLSDDERLSIIQAYKVDDQRTERPGYLHAAREAEAETAPDGICETTDVIIVSVNVTRCSNRSAAATRIVLLRHVLLRDFYRFNFSTTTSVAERECAF